MGSTVSMPTSSAAAAGDAAGDESGDREQEERNRLRMLRGIDAIFASLLSTTQQVPDEEIYQLVADGLVESLIPPNQSGRATIWVLSREDADPSACTLRQAATSSRGMQTLLDGELTVEQRIFLSNRARVRRNSALATSKSVIEEKGIPNKAGYDQMIYAAVIRAGRIAGVVGLGMHDSLPAGRSSSMVWRQNHKDAVEAVADLIALRMTSTSFLSRPVSRAVVVEDEEEYSWGSDPLLLDRVGRKETEIKEWEHGQVEEILGKTAEKLRPYGLRSVSAWEFDDGDLILWPGRRTLKAGVFAKTPIDTCETIFGSNISGLRLKSKEMRPLEQFELKMVAFLVVRYGYIRLADSATIDRGEAKCNEYLEDIASELRKSIDPDSFAKEKCCTMGDQYYMFKGKDEPTLVTTDFAAKIGSCPKNDVHRSDILLMPVLDRGCLRAILSLTFDSSSAMVEDGDFRRILRHSLCASKRLAAVMLGYQVLHCSTSIPNMMPLIEEIRNCNAVALTGAGFSLPAGLVSWSGLLRALLKSAVDTGDVDGDQGDYINALIQEGTADGFDKAAQILEVRATAALFHVN